MQRANDNELTLVDVLAVRAYQIIYDITNESQKAQPQNHVNIRIVQPNVISDDKQPIIR